MSSDFNNNNNDNNVLNFFQQRRQSFLQAMMPKSIAILFSARDLPHGRKNMSMYRQDSDFYYLTNFVESESLAVFIPNRAEGEYILFSLNKDPQIELWHGARIGQELACSQYGANQAFPLSMADEILPKLLAGKDHVYFNGIENMHNYELIIHWMNLLGNLERKGINKPTSFIDTRKILHNMRMKKDAYELELLRKAIQITSSAQKRAMQFCKPEMYEYELEAEIMHEYIKNDGRIVSFEPIVASGNNACTLHYNTNSSQLKDGDLVLIDTGVEYSYYAGDITRTFPVNGKFNPQQKIIYETVLAIQQTVINHVKPGIAWKDLQNLFELTLTEHLIELGFLQGKVSELVEQQAFKPFCGHLIGHWLGIDVHDVGNYKKEDEWVKLEAGMLLTIEPGLYIANDMANIDDKWKGIGVRIEDDLLVTENGYEILSKDVPKTVVDIENFLVTKK